MSVLNYENLIKTINELTQENKKLKSLLNQHGISFESIDLPCRIKTDSTNNIRLSPQDKINLYRSLFRGREDVYAVRWDNIKTNRSGYAPGCQNEWHKQLCRKPALKCSACPNQNWISLTDQAIYSHLKGDAFIGLYPLLKNDCCYFVAVDFDKESWKKDVLAFVSACNQYQVSHVVERSQSGNGAHVWIFFREAIAATTARSLATALLTLTVQMYPKLSMDSYDRLFPSQDTLPKGGFGNLIALPLQGDRRSQGNSTFVQVNNDFLPYPDPWALLQSLKTITQSRAIELLEQLQQVTGILDVAHVPSVEEELQPWDKQPEKNKPYPDIEEKLPNSLEIVKANLLYVPVDNIPAKLIHCIRKLAAFQNPEFYKAQAMRLSTFGKPRVIHCADIFSEHIGLPRGCEEKLLLLLEHYRVEVRFIEKRFAGKDIEASFEGQLSPDQKASVDSLLQHDIGVLSARTGFGKTVIAANMIAQRKVNTLVLVHRQ